MESHDGKCHQKSSLFDMSQHQEHRHFCTHTVWSVLLRKFCQNRQCSYCGQRIQTQKKALADGVDRCNCQFAENDMLSVRFLIVLRCCAIVGVFAIKFIVTMNSDKFGC